MSLDIIPRSFWNLPSRIPNLFDDEDWMSFLPSSGLTISEDDEFVFVETAIPGVDPNKVEITFDKGILWVKGTQEQTEEDKKKKFYRKASSNFSYRVLVPGEIDENQEPKANYKNGIMKIAFKKKAYREPKKIQVTQE